MHLCPVASHDRGVGRSFAASQEQQEALSPAPRPADMAARPECRRAHGLADALWDRVARARQSSAICRESQEDVSRRWPG